MMPDSTAVRAGWSATTGMTKMFPAPWLGSTGRRMAVVVGITLH